MAHVTMIHGIGNKPPSDVLLDAWERALAEDGGIDLGTRGVTSGMVYWADILYATNDSGDLESAEDGPDEIDDAWEDATSPEERAWTDSFAARFEDAPETGAEPDQDDAGYERMRLPAPITRLATKLLLRDVHHYLFNARHAPRPDETYHVRDEVRRRTIAALEEGASRSGPHVILSHSMGTVIAYDCLKRVSECPPVEGLITIGSPLGIEEIPTRFRPEWSRDDGFPHRKLDGDWVNVFDRLDPVAAAAPRLATVYQRNGTDVVLDIEQPNWGRWRHNIAKYLRGPALRSELGRMLDV